MTIHVELNPEVETQLAAEASARGMTLEQHAQRLLEDSVAAKSAARSRASLEEFFSALDALASKTPIPPHLESETFSRAVIYGDHD